MNWLKANAVWLVVGLLVLGIGVWIRFGGLAPAADTTALEGEVKALGSNLGSEIKAVGSEVKGLAEEIRKDREAKVTSVSDPAKGSGKTYKKVDVANIEKVIHETREGCLGKDLPELTLEDLRKLAGLPKKDK